MTVQNKSKKGLDAARGLIYPPPQSALTRRRNTGLALATAALTLLTACGGDSSKAPGSAGQDDTATLIYSYPLDGQAEVPTPTPVVLHFSTNVADTDLAHSVTLRHDGTDIPAQAEYTANGTSLILTPTNKLDPHSDYTVVIGGNSPIAGQRIDFSTRALEEGPRALVSSAEDLTLTRLLPSGGETDPLMDFSTLRLQFTQPLDRQTVVYGDGPGATVALLDADDEVVPAWVVVDGPYLTLDPKDDLTPGQEYRLWFDNDALASVYGETFAFQANDPRYRFTPASSLAQGTGPDQRPLPLVQRITTPEDQLERDDHGNSPLTGEPVNEIPVNAVLLGDSSTTFMARTQQQGDVLGDLAYLPDWPTVSPLRIQRGTLLTGSSIDVKIGGEVDAGFDSGTVNVQFLSDATGYLIPNVYDPNGPRLVRLFLDVAMSAEDPTANGAITQNIAHLELVGTAGTDTEEGVIDINAVGVVEPMILGQERGYGTLSFQLQTYRDQTEQLVERVLRESEDQTPPRLQSWAPGNHLMSQGVTEPFIFNFDEAIASESVTRAGITLTEMTNAGSRSVALDWEVRGAALVIQPREALNRPTQTGAETIEDVSYRLVLGDGITDLAGNTASLDKHRFEFSFPLETTETVFTDYRITPANGMEEIPSSPGRMSVSQAPIVLFAYPGYGCSMENHDLRNGIAGRCAGALAEDYVSVSGNVRRGADDLLPVMPLAANRPIVVHFSKEIAPESVRVGESLVVQKVSSDGVVQQDVPGTVTVRGKRLVFHPDELWEVDGYYRYVLGSNGDALKATETVTCDGSDAICDLSGLPLQTMLYDVTVDPDQGIFDVIAADAMAGGPDMINYFRGAPITNDVFMAMVNESRDTNANFYHDVNYPFPELKLGTGSVLWWPEYGFEEARPDSFVADPDADTILDPNGVLPVDNSAKVISKTIGAAYVAGDPLLEGMSVGCGWEEIADLNDPEEPRVVQSCPERKLTHLTSALAAEVTDEYDPEQGVKVQIWPGQIMSTALRVSNLMMGGMQEFTFDGGALLMRMRYAKDDPACETSCTRTRPITGWIKQVDDRPILTAEVDLYIDAIRLKDSLMVLGLGTSISHTLVSVPATMELSGDVSFLENGQMVVEQMNVNEMEIPFELETTVLLGNYVLAVPEGGSKLVYYGDKILTSRIDRG